MHLEEPVVFANHARRIALLRWAAVVVGLILIAGVVYLVVRRGADLASLASLGYPGVALLMFFSSSTVLLPAPGFAAVLAAGSVWNPLLVGVAAGIGSATGEVTGYLLGIGGGALLHLKEGKKWHIAHRWLERHGLLAILLLATVPNPIFDAVGLVAGSLAYPLGRFWLACVVGNSIKYTALALLASSASGWWLTR